MWGSFDELFEEAFNGPRMNFRDASDMRSMYFVLLSKYKKLKTKCDKLEYNNKHLKSAYDSLIAKYQQTTESTDIVQGHIYRKLKADYHSLKMEYSRLLRANIKMSDELTSLKFEPTEEDFS
jgi:hypothetical protein